MTRASQPNHPLRAIAAAKRFAVYDFVDEASCTYLFGKVDARNDQEWGKVGGGCSSYTANTRLVFMPSHRTFMSQGLVCDLSVS